jgi:anti-anti-sigma regulatory factor
MDFVRFEYRPQALPQLQAAVLAALEAGAERVVLDLDSLSALDDEATRGLITLLRRSRDIGGEIALSVNRPELRTELLSMALDRLFPLVQTEAAA